MKNLAYLTIRILLILTMWPSIHLSAQQNYAEIELIADSSEYDFEIMPVASLGRFGAFGAFGNKITALEDDGDEYEIRSFTLPDTVNIEEFFFQTDKIVFKYRNNVLWTTYDGHFDGMCFEDEDFQIANATDSMFFLIRRNALSISLFSMKNKDIESTYSFNEPPLTAGMMGSSIIAITDGTIFLVKPDETITLHQHLEPIKCAAITSMGIFFGTDNSLCRLVGIDEFEVIAIGKIKKIFGSNQRLYLIDTIDNLYKISFSGTDNDTCKEAPLRTTP